MQTAKTISGTKGVGAPTDRAYENLANAIIAQAAFDYQEALRNLEICDDDCDPEESDCETCIAYKQGRIDYLEKWFRGKAYAALTDVDPEYMIKKCKETYKDNLNAYGRVKRYAHTT